MISNLKNVQFSSGIPEKKSDIVVLVNKIAIIVFIERSFIEKLKQGSLENINLKENEEMDSHENKRKILLIKKLKLLQYKCQIKAYPQHISSSVKFKFDHVATTPHALYVWLAIALF